MVNPQRERRRERPRWQSRLLLFGPYLIVVAVGFGGFRQLEHDRHTDCQHQAQSLEVLREVVIESTAQTNPVHLESVPGFSDLDLATQTYLRNLSLALTAGNNAASAAPLRDRLLALIPNVKC